MCIRDRGNTGALLASGLLIVGRIKGILRPALATLLPSAKGPKMLIDAGANTNCKPENLVQFGIMGSIYTVSYTHLDVYKRQRVSRSLIILAILSDSDAITSRKRTCNSLSTSGISASVSE